MSLHLKKIAAAASVTILALGASACGQSDGPSSSPRSSGGTGTSASPAAQEQRLTKESFADTLVAAQRKARTSHIQMVIEAGGQKVTAEGDQVSGETVADNAAAITMDLGASGPGELKVTVVDGQFYMFMGPLTGGKYAKADLSDKSDPITQQLAPTLEQLDTAGQVEALASAVTSVQKKGAPETIDGVKAQPYEVTVDTTKMDAIQALPAEARSSIPATLTYTMFLGPDDLLRRMAYAFGGITGTVTLTQWGEPVDISAPPADQLSDKSLSTLLRGASV